jgi:LacI family transcriptional regulator
MLTSENDEIVEQLRHSHTPLVVISDKSLSREFNSVTINNYEASYKLSKHVFSKKKYSSVKYISGPKSNIDSQMRRDGFKDACREFSIPIKKKDIIEGDFTFESGERICKEFFSEEKIPELILTGNDMMALGCIKVINKNKLKLGEEIFIAGIDGIILGQMISPRLTTMKIQTELIGTNAVKMLLEQMKNNSHKHKNSNVVTELLKGNTI